MTNSITWFRRDLRLADNHALADADRRRPRRRTGRDPAVRARRRRCGTAAGANRAWFLAGCLAELDAALDGRLVVRHGDPAEVIPRAAPPATTSRAVFRAQDVGDLRTRAATSAVAEALAADDARGRRGRQPVGGAGRARCAPAPAAAFKVYSAYLRAWRQQRLAATCRRPERRADRRRRALRRRADGARRSPPTCPSPARTAAHRALDRFLASRRRRLRRRPQRPRRRRAPAGCRRTSSSGCLHPRQLLRRLDGRNRVARHVRQGAGVARLLRRRARTPGRTSAWRSWNPQMAAWRSTAASRPTSGSRRGARGGPASRSSTPGCASSSPRGGCTTGCG